MDGVALAMATGSNVPLKNAVSDTLNVYGQMSKAPGAKPGRRAPPIRESDEAAGREYPNGGS